MLKAAQIVEIAMRSDPRLEALHPLVTSALETIRYMIESAIDRHRDDAQAAELIAENQAMLDERARLEIEGDAKLEELVRAGAQRIDASVIVERGGPVYSVKADAGSPTP